MPEPLSEDRPITLYLLIRHQVYCEALGRAVNTCDHVNVVGSARHPLDLRCVIDEVMRLKPDVVLTDGWRLPEEMQVCREIRECCPESKIVVLSHSSDFSTVVDAAKAGVAGYIGPGSGLTHLERCLLDLRGGGDGGLHVVLDPSTLPDIKMVSRNGLAEKLSARETEILQRMASGASNQEIARHLFLSKETVKTAISSLFRKMEVTDRTQAVVVALRAGILD